MKALVLRKLPFGESDLIVHLLLEDGRRVSAFAPGGRRSKKRFPHQFHFAGIYEVETHREFQNEKMSRLSRCDLKHFDLSISENMQTLSRWMMILEWIHSDEAVAFEFSDVEQVMTNISKEGGAFYFHQFFLLQMKLHGLLPRLDSCAICDQALAGAIRFSFFEGGVIHALCGDGVRMTTQSLEFLRESFQGSPSSTSFNHEVISELDEITVPFLEHQLGRNLKTRRFFEQLESQNMEVNPPQSKKVSIESETAMPMQSL